MPTRSVLAIAVALVAFATSTDAQEFKGARPFIATAFTKPKVLVVSPAGKVEWELEAPSCFDVWLLPNKNYLIASRSKGILEVTPDRKAVVKFKPEGETYTCQPLVNGSILVGDNQHARLLEVDANGKVERTIPVDTKSNPHSSIRSARKLASDRYLVCLRGDNVVREYDAAGKTQWEFKTSGPMSAVRLPNGNTLVAGASLDVVEVDKGGKTVWDFSRNHHNEAGLKPSGVAYGIQRLPNGNTVAAYTGGLIAEIAPDRKVVWSRQDDFLKGVTCFQILDTPGDPTKGEILR